MSTKSLLLAAAASVRLVSGAQDWTLTSAPMTNWSSVACSAEGGKLVAVIYGGGIYVSTNSGGTWMPTTAPITNWLSTASSADGTRLVAAAHVNGSGGPIYVSTNAGGTWTDSGAPYYPWSMVSSSADGRTLLAGWGQFPVGGGLFISTDSSATWTSPSVVNAFWQAVSVSADGCRLVALGNTGLGHLGTGASATSANGGRTWTGSYDGPGQMHLWIAVAGSADGRTLLGGTPDALWVSRHFGADWNAVAVPNLFWSTLACSADATRMAGVGLSGSWGAPGTIYVSADSGATWSSNDSSNLTWSSVASSADGCKLVATVNGGGIYVLQTIPSPVLNINLSADTLVLSWTVPSQPFVLQENADLTTTNWTDVPITPVLNFTNVQNQVALPLVAGRRFYRLKGL